MMCMNVAALHSRRYVQPAAIEDPLFSILLLLLKGGSITGSHNPVLMPEQDRLSLQVRNIGVSPGSEVFRKLAQMLLCWPVADLFITSLSALLKVCTHDQMLARPRQIIIVSVVNDIHSPTTGRLSSLFLPVEFRSSATGCLSCWRWRPVHFQAPARSLPVKQAATSDSEESGQDSVPSPPVTVAILNWYYLTTYWRPHVRRTHLLQVHEPA